MDSNSNKFKLHPENDFVEGVKVTGEAILGQAYIENSDSNPEIAEKYDYSAIVTLKVFQEDQASSVMKNAKGLLAMASLTPVISEHKNLGFGFDVKCDGTNVNIELGCSKEFFEAVTKKPTIDLMELIGKYGLKLGGTLRLGFSPPSVLTKCFEDVIEPCYDISIEGYGDELLRRLFEVIHIDLDRQAKNKNDVIAHNLAFPIVEQLAKYIGNDDKIDFDYIYDKSNLKNTIIEYNQKWGDFKHEREGMSVLQSTVRDFLQNEFKKLCEGFFGAYFKVLDTINLNNFEIRVFSKLRMFKLTGEITIPGVVEYVKDNILCYIKK